MNEAAMAMAAKLAQDPRTESSGGDPWLFVIKGLTESQCWEVLDSFGPKAKDVSPAEFGKAKRRMFPPE